MLIWKQGGNKGLMAERPKGTPGAFGEAPQLQRRQQESRGDRRGCDLKQGRPPPLQVRR